MTYEGIDLAAAWYLIIGVLFTGYAMLDGFDLGVGAIHLFAETDEERRILLNAIGPVWDGNEVWLVTGGGALFAAFPAVYATVFSGFYLAFVLLLFALIFRAVAIEFRSKQPGRRWRAAWDTAFSVSSIASSLLIGIAMGNITRGLPLNAAGEYEGGLAPLLNPYALLLGVTTLALFAMHGSIYATMKTEGAFHKKLRRRVISATIAFIICYAVFTMATLIYMPHMADRVREHPWMFGIAVLNMLAIANIPRELHRGRDMRAFLSSCAAMAAMMALFGLQMFPVLVRNSADPAHSLTLANSASSRGTLATMFTIALIGVPIVLTYTVCIYRVFRGKVVITKMSY